MCLRRCCEAHNLCLQSTPKHLTESCQVSVSPDYQQLGSGSSNFCIITCQQSLTICQSCQLYKAHAGFGVVIWYLFVHRGFISHYGLYVAAGAQIREEPSTLKMSQVATFDSSPELKWILNTLTVISMYAQSTYEPTCGSGPSCLRSCLHAEQKWQWPMQLVILDRRKQMDAGQMENRKKQGDSIRKSKFWRGNLMRSS